jgi:hypothetical protein
VVIRDAVVKLAEDMMLEAPTIELCTFVGSLAAINAALENIVQAGPPKPDPGEEEHPLR